MNLVGGIRAPDNQLAILRCTHEVMLLLLIQCGTPMHSVYLSEVALQHFSILDRQFWLAVKVRLRGRLDIASLWLNRLRPQPLVGTPTEPCR